MSQYNTKYSKYFRTIFASLTVALILAGCKDDAIYNTVEIPDAEVEFQGDVIFRPFATAEIHTRSEAPDGPEYDGIKSLFLFFFDSEEKPVKKYCGTVTFAAAPSNGSTHQRVTFKKKVRAGQYRVFAMANIDENQLSELEKIESIDELRHFKLNWNDDINNDLEMFGVFGGERVAPDNKTFEEAPLITITPQQDHFYAWVRRAASKVTVDFDGTKLMDDVTVYIKSATLKDVASGAYLGAESHAESAKEEEITPADAANGTDKIVCIESSSYSINYGTGEADDLGAKLTNKDSFTPAIWGETYTSFHDEKARALPCYENMQGEREGTPKLQDSDNDGIIDSSTKDGVDNGTYLEVTGYYIAKRPEYKSQGEIKYRFMLGQNETNDFNLIRNHHYKITLHLKGYGNDVDWHIEYAEQYLDASFPHDIDYQGRFFVPSWNYTVVDNLGQTFNKNDTITVTSYQTEANGENTWLDPSIERTYQTYNEETGAWDDDPKGDWLSYTSGNAKDENTKKDYIFTFEAGNSDYVEKPITFPSQSIGKNPYNLSNENGDMGVENTANCYMVGQPGTYCFPLVYGNAISENQNPNSAAFAGNIVNHLGRKITKPYISEDVPLNPANLSVVIVWQDAKNLINPKSLIYDHNMFGTGKGGIKFETGTLTEGNAVIALIDKSLTENNDINPEYKIEYGTTRNTKAVWSWHIWATRFGFDYQKNIRIQNLEDEEFDVLPVNLGWCSGGKAIRYYKRRRCNIKFKVGNNEIVRTIEQYPHFALPRGNHPYYQWGRKEPFIGTDAYDSNKERWGWNDTKHYLTASPEYNPARIYNEPDDRKDDNRKNTKDCLNELIQNPDKWHNANREDNPKSTNKWDKYLSINQTYPDLWSSNGQKTIYDPCPPGYQVGHYSVFSAVASQNKILNKSNYWNDVLEKDMAPGYLSGNVNTQVIEIYTDSRKIESITFPISGYRDYDYKATVVSFYNSYTDENGKLIVNNGEGFIWSNTYNIEKESFHLKLSRPDLPDGTDWKDRPTGAIAAQASFFNTDGFGIRPVRRVP